MLKKFKRGKGDTFDKKNKQPKQLDINVYETLYSVWLSLKVHRMIESFRLENTSRMFTPVNPALPSPPINCVTKYHIL